MNTCAVVHICVNQISEVWASLVLNIMQIKDLQLMFTSVIKQQNGGNVISLNLIVAWLLVSEWLSLVA